MVSFPEICCRITHVVELQPAPTKWVGPCQFSGLAPEAVQHCRRKRKRSPERRYNCSAARLIVSGLGACSDGQVAKEKCTWNRAALTGSGFLVLFGVFMAQSRPKMQSLVHIALKGPPRICNVCPRLFFSRERWAIHVASNFN